MDPNKIKWVKASKSGAAGHCVEVAAVDGGFKVRNSRYPDVELPTFTPAEWTAFLDGAAKGEFTSL